MYALTLEEIRDLNALLIWQVVDNHTGLTMGKPLNRKAASRKQDRLDNVYGGYRYGVKQVQQ
jgi:hypothetical protein